MWNSNCLPVRLNFSHVLINKSVCVKYGHRYVLLYCSCSHYFFFISRSWIFMVCPFFNVPIILAVLLQLTDSDYPFGIFKLLNVVRIVRSFAWFSEECFVDYGLSFFMFPLYRLSLLDIRLLITPLVSSNF